MPVYLSDPATTQLVGPYEAPNCIVRGIAHGSLFRPNGYSLWRVAGGLDSGAELEWDTQHGDEALYLLEGSVVVAGRRIDEGSALIIECGVPAVLRALDDARLLHFGPVATDAPTGGLLGAADEDGRGTHIVTPEEAAPFRVPGEPVETLFFTDGTCRTCRIAFIYVDGNTVSGSHTGLSHSHSEDEIIHVLDGELQVGPNVVTAGMSIAIPGHYRYAVRRSGRFRFLNYRRDVATFTAGPRSKRVVTTETVADLRQQIATGIGDFATPR